MKQYYLGGYYLFALRAIDFGPQKGKRSYTCTTCINDSLFDDWSFSWSTRSYKQEQKVKRKFNITDQTIETIREWTDGMLEKHRVGWCNVFNDAATAESYRQCFFSHLSAVKTMVIYFDEDGRESYFRKSQPEVVYENLNQTGIIENLRREIVEPVIEYEVDRGFDLIAVEVSGDFHSFQCQDWDELTTKFDLCLNEWGLLEELPDWQPVLDYLNDDTNGFEPLPWFAVKVKQVLPH